MIGWKLTKFLMSYLKPYVSFSLNFASLFIIMGDESSVLKLYMIFRKEPTTKQHFRLLTAQVKFHQICTLIGYFCWKYTKFGGEKKYGGVMSHDTKEWRKIWKKNLFFVLKMTRIWQIFIRKLESVKLVFSWDPFVQSRKYMSYKLTEEL